MSGAKAVIAIALAGGALGGCASESEDGQPKRSQQESAMKKPSDARVIRAWSRALNARDYDRAAAFFAPRAIVDQGTPIRLPNRAAAVAFNRSLPCKGTITDVEDEGATSLASFRLSRGPGGQCRGRARVRFTIRDGRFSEFRQLPGAPIPQGDAA